MTQSRNIKLVSDDGRLIIRPPLIEDASTICEAVIGSMQELVPWMDWCHPGYSMDETVQWLEGLPQAWVDGENFAFCVFDAMSGESIGGCGLNHINRTYRLANLGYWVRSSRAGRGVATEAARQVAQFGFSEVGLQRVELVAAVENWASRRVADKTGAQFEGILRKRIKIGDKHLDAAMYSLIPSDFLAPI